MSGEEQMLNDLTALSCSRSPMGGEAAWRNQILYFYIVQYEGPI